MNTIYVTATEPTELKPPKNRRRATLFLQNLSGDPVYFAEDSIATPENGIELGAGLQMQLTEADGPVPQGNVWVTGSVATRQRVVVREA